MNIEKVNEEIDIACEVYSNSRTWGHIARCFYKGNEVAKCKMSYHNRTYEAREFDSVKGKLLGKLKRDKIISQENIEAIENFIN